MLVVHVVTSLRVAGCLTTPLALHPPLPTTPDFYWMFESRSDPANDPLVVWLTGGPGCSSILALFFENGPCSIHEDGQSTKPNPFGWNDRANVIWVDQPAGGCACEHVYAWWAGGRSAA
jgi:hypothetical protein